MTETSGFARVRVHETADTLTVEVSGDAADSQSHDLRVAVEQCVSSSEKPLVLDLTGLSSWEHEAQGFLLHLVREQRHRGRTVEVIGLAGYAESQAYASGMQAFFRSEVAVDDAPVETVEEHVLPPATSGEHAYRGGRPAAHATCQYGHPAGELGSRCDEGHLVLPV
jgi:hypothetical protein